jgi:Rieske Fe-S protein
MLLPACQAGSDLPTAKSTTCGASTCIDLGDAANAALVTAGGAMLVDTARDTIMVIRMSATVVLALSAICTHDGCSMNFDEIHQQLTCPCHGSVFSEAGAVVQGPAREALAVYTATLDASATTITIA